MNTPDQLQSSSQLPDDLKALFAELKVPTNDPILPLLAWVWKQMIETKTAIDSAKLSVAAVFDQRLEKITATADLLASIDANLVQINKQLEAKPLNIKEQVEEELAEPIKTAVESCRKLDELVKSLLKRVDQKFSRTQRRLNIALFISGFTGGGLIIACLFHLFSSH